MTRILAALILFALWAPSAHALSTNKAPAEAAEAYIALVEADLARDKQDWPKAIETYRTATERYRQLAKKNPDWEPDIVKYRLAYCANQVEWAERKKKAAEDAASSIDPSDGTEITRDKYSALLQENEYIHRCLRELQEQIQEQENTEELKNKLQHLASENVKLRQRLSSTETTPAPVEPEIPTPEAPSESAEELESTPPPTQPPVEEVKSDRLEELLSTISGPMETAQEPVAGTVEAPPPEKTSDEELFPIEQPAEENPEPPTPVEEPQPVEEEEVQRVESNDPNADLFAPVPMGIPEPPKPVSTIETNLPEKTVEPVVVETNIPDRVVEPVMVETNIPAESIALPAEPKLDIPILLREALLLEQEMKFTEATEKYTQILSIETNQTDALKGQGRCYVQTGNAEQALEVLQRAADLDPKDTQVLLLLGMSHCLIKQYHEAIAVLTKAVKRDPKNAYARNTLGAACLSVGDLKPARKHLNIAIRLDPQLSVAYYNLAQVYGFDLPPQLEKARENYRKALDLGTTPDPEFEKLISYP